MQNGVHCNPYQSTILSAHSVPSTRFVARHPPTHTSTLPTPASRDTPRYVCFSFHLIQEAGFLSVLDEAVDGAHDVVGLNYRQENLHVNTKHSTVKSRMRVISHCHERGQEEELCTKSCQRTPNTTASRCESKNSAHRALLGVR